MTILKTVCVLAILIIFNIMVTTALRNDTLLVSKFLKRLTFLLPNWISQRIRIIVPTEGPRNYDQSKGVILANAYDIYKELSIKSYVSVSLINDTGKMHKGTELRIFPFASNLSEVCNLYFNH